jgi:SAM-dependent methyltransferase
VAAGEEPNVSPPDSYDQMWNEVYGDLQRFGPAQRHMRRLLRGMLGSLEYETVLDVGCGAGDSLSLLTEGRDLRRLCGVDVSVEALRRIRARFPGDFRELDIESERLDEGFDLVFSSLVLEHLPNDLEALHNMRSMTRRHLLVTTIAGSFERYRSWDERMGHVRNYQVGELEEKVTAAGFTVESAVYWGFPFYSPLVRLLQNRMSAEPSYGAVARGIAQLTYWLYFLNSRRRGDLLLLLAKTSRD